jgi:hypothetical protein
MNKFNAVYENFSQLLQNSDNDFMEKHDTFGPSLDMMFFEFMGDVMNLINSDIPPKDRKKAKNVAARWIKGAVWDKINDADQDRGVSL